MACEFCGISITRYKKMKKVIFQILGITMLLTACTGTVLNVPNQLPASTDTSLPPTQPATATRTFTASPTFTSTSTPTPSPTPTATWVVQGPGDVTIPILLYHRIDISPIKSRYYVTPEKFEAQLKLLHEWEYTTITTRMLIQAITQGAELPPRPLLITFDDGHLDNYTIAFPIMQKYGFTGVLYIVYNYIDADQYMNVDQILEMHNAGWEVGSHSLNHFDLTKLDDDKKRAEIVESREVLQELLGFPIETFAYPFGTKDGSVLDYVHFAGYIGAMGASGYTPAQGKWNLFYLQRVEIKGSEDAKTFTRFLPWQGDPIYLPTNTPIP
jgi:peptidoglycan/xylan/chitin deacetylase (PgdA/CDA1 family)